MFNHVISYKEDRKWGETARRLTAGRGVDIIVQVAGVNEMEQSIEAIKMCGVITIVGFLAGPDGPERDGLPEMSGQDVYGAASLCGQQSPDGGDG